MEFKMDFIDLTMFERDRTLADEIYRNSLLMHDKVEFATFKSQWDQIYNNLCSDKEFTAEEMDYMSNVIYGSIAMAYMAKENIVNYPKLKEHEELEREMYINKKIDKRMYESCKVKANTIEKIINQSLKLTKKAMDLAIEKINNSGVYPSSEYEFFDPSFYTRGY